MALPTLILFHNSKPMGKYNLTEYSLGKLSDYLTLFTGIEAQGPQNLTEEDWQGQDCQFGS